MTLGSDTHYTCFYLNNSVRSLSDSFQALVGSVAYMYSSPSNQRRSNRPADLIYFVPAVT